ncbi:hypothetical protein MNBD_GAMMA14-2443, partial [hydrothermal vent metagenome]
DQHALAGKIEIGQLDERHVETPLFSKTFAKQTAWQKPLINPSLRCLDPKGEVSQ